MKINALEAVGISSVVMAVLSVFLSLVFGAAILLELFALLVAGVSAIQGDRLYAWITVIIVTLDLAFVSVLPHLQITTNLVIVVGISYFFSFVCVIVGYLRQRTKSKDG